VLLVGLTQSADAGTKLRPARDISGVWGDAAFSFTYDPSLKPGEPQKVVLQPEYETRYQAQKAARAKAEKEGKPLSDYLTLCLPAGMPGTMRAMSVEIVAKDKAVYVITEGTDPLRRIFLDGRPIPPPDDLNPTFVGFSVGRWEGDTLVVDTAGIKTSTTLEDVPHSDAFRVNERIRLLDDDTLEDKITMTDPIAFKEPWVITRQYKAYSAMSKEHGTYPDYKGGRLVPGELVCNENNRNLPDANGVAREGYIGTPSGGSK
jgi:hypothetical protein